MSAKVLHLVNSAFFGIFQAVNSPARPVSLLGIDTVKGLVLGVGAEPEMDSTHLQAKGFGVKIDQWREIGTEYLQQGDNDD